MFGIMVVRVTPRGGEALAPLEELTPRVAGPWPMSLPCQAFMNSQIRHGGAPVVVTACGYVLAATEATSLRLSEGGPVGIGYQPWRPQTEVTLTLRQAEGAWAETVRGRTLHTPPGNPWVWWTVDAASRWAA